MSFNKMWESDGLTITPCRVLRAFFLILFMCTNGIAGLLAAATTYTNSTSNYNGHRALSHLLCPTGRKFVERTKIASDGKKLAETSYIAHSTQTYKGESVFWIGSDKQQDEIHAVSLTSRKILMSYRLYVERRGDWEDIALGPCTSSSNSQTCIYIQNAGDNASNQCHSRSCTGGRKKLFIYKLLEPDLSQLDRYDGTRIKVVTLRYTYTHKSWPTNRADSEAMFVDWTGNGTPDGKPGDIYLMTKQPYDRKYQSIGLIPVRKHENLTPITDSKSESYWVRAKAVSKASLEQPWTAADMSRDGTLIAVRREERIFFYSRNVARGQSVADAMKATPCSFISETYQDGKDQQQFEAVAFMDGGKRLIAEASECLNQQSCDVPITVYKLSFP